MRVLVAFVRAYPWRSALSLVVLVVAGAAEGVSLGALLPLLDRRLCPGRASRSEPARRQAVPHGGRCPRAHRPRAEPRCPDRRRGLRPHRAQRPRLPRVPAGRLHDRAHRHRPASRARARPALGALGVLPGAAGRALRQLDVERGGPGVQGVPARVEVRGHGDPAGRLRRRRLLRVVAGDLFLPVLRRGDRRAAASAGAHGAALGQAPDPAPALDRRAAHRQRALRQVAQGDGPREARGSARWPVRPAPSTTPCASR